MFLLFLEVGVLTGRRSDIEERRCRELVIRIINLESYDESAGLAEIPREEHLSSNQVGYVGDDVQKLSVFKKAGFRAAPPNAAHEVQVAGDCVTARSGGNDAVREVAELVLTALNRRDQAIAATSGPGVTPPPGREGAPSEPSLPARSIGGRRGPTRPLLPEARAGTFKRSTPPSGRATR